MRFVREICNCEFVTGGNSKYHERTYTEGGIDGSRRLCGIYAYVFIVITNR